MVIIETVRIAMFLLFRSSGWANMTSVGAPFIECLSPVLRQRLVQSIPQAASLGEDGAVVAPKGLHDEGIN
jgi:hypothetical protein